MKTVPTIVSRRLLTRVSLAVLAVAGASFSSALSASPGDAPDLTAAMRADAASLHQHVMTLANPFFEGRAPGLRGNTLAAEYLEHHFKRIGLTPAFPRTETVNGAEVVTPRAAYRQPFEFGRSLTVTKAEASFDAGGGAATAFRAGTDFNVLGFSGNAEVTGPLVFAGYAIPEGPDGYNSFPEGSDLQGKIAVVLRFEPMTPEGKSRWGESWTPRAGLEPKIRAAVERGAAGVILVSPPGADDPRVDRLESATDTQPARAPVDVPVVMLAHAKADEMIRRADAGGRSLTDLRRLADESGVVVDLPGATVTLSAALQRVPVITDNVGAILEGRGELASEFVVVGAHYDHVGYGVFGSRAGTRGRGQLHPGADDNASGTSGMLVAAANLARMYAELPKDEPARSILFLGFSAEESGLIGSRHYTRHAITDREKHYVMLNMDMIGRLRRGQLELGGVGTGQGLHDLIRPLIDSSGLTVAAKPGGFGPSDHASFFGWGIPVLFFFTGLHEEYHMPTDTADTINAEGAAQVIDLVQRIVLACATRREAMPVVKDGEAARSERPGNPDRQADPGAAGPARLRVRFGIAPGDYSGSEPGVLVGSVTEGTSAAEAGLQAGDLITAWNGKPVKTVEDWFAMLTEHNPGDKVEITLRRKGEEVKTTATLKAARARGNE